MPEVTVDVGGRSYRLGCGEGEEAHLQGLASMLDSEAQGLKRQFGQMPEGRLMLMVGLIVADRLTDASRKLDATQRKLTEAKELAETRADGGDLFDAGREDDLARRVDALVERIESIANTPAAAGSLPPTTQS